MSDFQTFFGSECHKIVWNLRAVARRISYLCPKGFSETPDTFPWHIGSFPALLLMTILIFYSQTIDIDFIPVAKSDLLGWSQLRWQQPGVYLVRTINSAVAQLKFVIYWKGNMSKLRRTA